MTRTAIVTGAAGFIGMHVCGRLLDDGWNVIGIDAVTDYYDVSLKEARIDSLTGDRFTFHRTRIESEGVLTGLFADHKPDAVIHLAAQAGVRYSIEAPRSYAQANLLGTLELLEAARAHPPAHLLLASTSSAYGANRDMPYREGQKADHPMSFYAATKKANEAMAHSYAHLYDLPTTMFRFFTVYGPWGRPDMALFKFVKATLRGEAIDLYNNGDMQRDFTYVSDLVDSLVRLIDVVPGKVPVSDADSLSPVAPFRVVNIGNGAPKSLDDFVAAIEDALDRRAKRNLMPMQPGDVPATWADTTLLEALVGETQKTPLTTGVRLFVEWYRTQYDV